MLAKYLGLLCIYEGIIIEFGIIMSQDPRALGLCRVGERPFPYWISVSSHWLCADGLGNLGVLALHGFDIPLDTKKE